MNRLKGFVKSLLPERLVGFLWKVRHPSGWKRNVVSGRYEILVDVDRRALKERFSTAWKDSAIPDRQIPYGWKHVNDYKTSPALKSLVSMMRSAKPKPDRVLEIGCSSGHHSAVFKRAGLCVSYEGCDYSPVFIAKARKLCPDLSFRVADATVLPYSDGSFDTVISGCCILHIIDYEKAVAEAARVAKDRVIFHRTPVIRDRPTVFAKKIGYGVPMVEIMFNEDELLALFAGNGLSVVSAKTVGSYSVPGVLEPVVMKNYLCKKT